MIVTDQMDRNIRLGLPLTKIVSLVPSHTELFIDLGLNTLVKGRTKFCIHPQNSISDIPTIGGTKTIKHETIYKIEPDLIFANKEENNKNEVEQLSKLFPVWVSDISSLQDSFDMIEAVGELFDQYDVASNIIAKSKNKLDNLKIKTNQTAVYLIWRKPYMTVGSDTYIHNMMEHLGYDNLFKDYTRYPEITIQDIRNVQPDVVLLSSEPYPFSHLHKNELKEALPDSTIELVDGEVFSWYGSRILHKNSILIY